MQHVGPLAVRLLPIKLALVVLRAERREQPLRLLATVHNGPRLRARLARRALSKDELLRVLLLPLWRGRREEGADVAEGQADPRAALCWIFGVLWPLVRVYAVHPAGIGREAHDEERVVRERDALRRALHRCSAVTVVRMLPIGIGGPIAPSGGGDSILLRLERHSASSAEGEIDDARVAHDIDRLVRVFRDVVRARAVQLDEHVIYGVL